MSCDIIRHNDRWSKKVCGQCLPDISHRYPVAGLGQHLQDEYPTVLGHIWLGGEHDLRLYLSQQFPVVRVIEWQSTIYLAKMKEMFKTLWKKEEIVCLVHHYMTLSYLIWLKFSYDEKQLNAS